MGVVSTLAPRSNMSKLAMAIFSAIPVLLATKVPAIKLQTAGFGAIVLLTTLPPWFVAKVGLFVIRYLPKTYEAAVRKILASLVYRTMNVC